MLNILKFYSQKCGPCKQIEKMVNDVAEETGTPIESIDALEDVRSGLYKIRAVPTLVFIKDGTEVERKTGLISKPDLLALIEKHN